jgi:hypothetical protein
MGKRKIILINIISLVVVILILIVSQLDWRNTKSIKNIEWSGMSTRGIKIEKTTVPEKPIARDWNTDNQKRENQ